MDDAIQVSANDDLDKINRAIAFPEHLYTSDGFPCQIVHWHPEVNAGEFVRVNFSASIHVENVSFFQKMSAMPECLYSPDGRRFGICAWRSSLMSRNQLDIDPSVEVELIDLDKLPPHIREKHTS